MIFSLGIKCLVLTDSWEEIKHYKVSALDTKKIELREFLDFQNTGPVRTIIRKKNTDIFASPYTMQPGVNPHISITAELIRNLASSWVRTKGKFPIAGLLTKLTADKRLAKVPIIFVEGCLRSCVASEFFSVWWDGRCKSRTYEIQLSKEQIERERSRMFASTFASELSEMSERIRLIVQHTSTVGTYRENLLQSLLRRNLPERYHVATGFIYGCPRQLDIVIYDRLEYAPLFREGDLVVVPVESVRGVIEVKTDLNKVELESSLKLMDEVASVDDGMPPFFRGIFGFESGLSSAEIFSAFADFYTREIIYDPVLDVLHVQHICEPHRHATCVCVLGHAYAFVDYIQDERHKFVPTLVERSSATGLKTQAAHFVQLLLAYLRHGGLKRVRSDEITQMLGADTVNTNFGKLTPLENWGAYFSQEEGLSDDDSDVEALEIQVNAVRSWLQGENWAPKEN